MTQFQFRNGFEEGTINIYAIAFQCTLEYNVEVMVDQAWVSAKSLPTIATLLPPNSTTMNPIVEGTDPLYISDSIVAIFSVEQIALAIASNPMDSHEIQWSSQVIPHSWQSDQLIHTHVKKLLGEDCPKFIHDSTANAIDDGYWPVWEKPSIDMTLQSNVYLQREGQAWIPCKVRRWVGRYYATIKSLIKVDLRQNGTSTIPYIGTFTLKGTRVSFKASRHLKNRLKGITAPEERLEGGRAFGGENTPSKSTQLWYHTNHKKLSKRRQFVVRMANAQSTHWQNKSLANTAFQIFCDAFIFRLVEGEKVIWPSIGTFRPSNGRVHFRKSRVFDNDVSQ